MELIKSIQQLESLFDKRQFVEDTCQQIMKDLGGLVDNNIDLKLDFQADILLQITSQLSEVLGDLSSSQIKQFLYRVDLNESIAYQTSSQGNGFQNLAEKVVIREAQKVYLRQRFKS